MRESESGRDIQIETEKLGRNRPFPSLEALFITIIIKDLFNLASYFLVWVSEKSFLCTCACVCCFVLLCRPLSACGSFCVTSLVKVCLAPCDNKHNMTMFYK